MNFPPFQPVNIESLLANTYKDFYVSIGAEIYQSVLSGISLTEALKDYEDANQPSVWSKRSRLVLDIETLEIVSDDYRKAVEIDLIRQAAFDGKIDTRLNKPKHKM